MKDSEELSAQNHLPGRVSLWGVVAMGIGSMVGAGVFALLGQIAIRAGQFTWLVFVIAGVIALFSGYAYARLSATFPSSGGVIAFFSLGFGRSRLALTLSNLYLITLMLTLAMVSEAFGSYGARLLHDVPTTEQVNLLASAILLLIVGVNYLGAQKVGQLESVLVMLKLLILLLLVVAGVMTLHHRPATELVRLPVSGLFSSIGLAFFAYAGFGMMANASASVRSPARTMPLAFFIAILTVILLYVILAWVMLANVPGVQLLKYADTAVAQMAKPVLGQWGFTLVTCAALFATSSAIMASLFSLRSISDAMVVDGSLPVVPLPRAHQRAGVTFWILVLTVLMLINGFELDSIASIASIGFLACYLGVFGVAWKRRRECGANVALLLGGGGLMLLLLLAFLFELLQAKQWLQCVTLVVAVCLSLMLSARALHAKVQHQ
ncbi:APC family permease [Shewanella sp. GXUN23E]|uniref:APC family permease n=1 Tax=Shewanella sp. GXUN23E TaxID=3422498 RepID=UPI003D7CA7EE